MNELNISIVVGVFSGLLASAIGLIIRSIWINNIKPAYENAIYKDAKIEGKWIGFMVFEYEEQEVEKLREYEINDYILELSRNGHSLKGIFIGTKGGDEGRIFDLSGSFRNLIVTSVFESKNRQCIERGCLNLMLKNNGLNLEGYYSNYQDSKHEVFAQKIVFKRNNA